MALVFYDGFESSKNTSTLLRDWEAGDLSGASFISSPVNPLLTALAFVGGNFLNTFSFTARSRWVIGLRYLNLNVSLGSNWNLIAIKMGSSTQCRLRVVPGTDGIKSKFELVRGGTTNSDGTILHTSAEFNPGWYYLELDITVHETTGAYHLKVNELTAFQNVGAVNTSAVGGGVNTADNFRFQNLSDVGQGAALDDIYINDDQAQTVNGVSFSTFLGDVVIEALIVTADGATNNFPTQIPGSGSHFDKVDDPVTSLPDDSTTVVVSTADAQKELFTMSDLTVIQSNILAVRAEVYAKLTNTGSRNLKHTYRQGTGGSSGMEADSAVIALTQTVFDPPLHYIMVQNPVTSAAWTLTDVNTMQLGVETGT